MAHPYAQELHWHRNFSHRSGRHTHVHFIALLLLVAVVLAVTLTARDYRAPARPSYDDRTPATAPRLNR